MEIIVKAENENDVNKPDEVFNRLYSQRSEERHV